MEQTTWLVQKGHDSHSFVVHIAPVDNMQRLQDSDWSPKGEVQYEQRAGDVQNLVKEDWDRLEKVWSSRLWPFLIGLL